MWYIENANAMDEVEINEQYEDYDEAVNQAERYEALGIDIFFYSDEDFEDEEYDDYDECGFDPYMGCYSYDC